MDSNGDGYGDLQGIRSKIPYLKDIGMDGVWLSPIFTSPQKDGGYDIANYTDVDPIFGTLTDFDQLLQTCKDNGVHLILDFVPNVTYRVIIMLDFFKMSCIRSIHPTRAFGSKNLHNEIRTTKIFMYGSQV